MKVKIMYYDKHYDAKPDALETAKIQRRIAPTEIEIKDLATGLANGSTFKPAYLTGAKNSDWTEQQIFALDFDHGTTAKQELDRCVELGILPCFAYSTFHDGENENHFRLVFCAKEVITDITKRNALQGTLVNLFNNSDANTKDPSRLFYGGRKLIYEGYDNRIDTDSILALYGSKTLVIQGKSEPKINPTHEDDNLPNIDAIKHLDVKKLHKLVGAADAPVQLKSEKEVYTYLNKIDLSEYLGIYDNVCCILPEHDDHEPSAYIYTTDDGTQVYKCFGCGHAYTIISITEKLAKCKRHEAIEFIKQVYSIELVQSDWAIEQRQLMIDSANYLDSEDFEITFPTLAKLIRTRKCHIKSILYYLSQYVNDDMKINGKPYFYASYNTLMDVCGINGNRNTLAQSLTLFCLLHMIEKLPADEIPKKELNKAREIAARYNHRKLTSFYSFEEYGTMLFEESEEIAKTLKDNNMTLKGLSREYILRTFSTQLADKVYPQYKYENQQGNTRQSDEHTLQITECLFYLLDEKGYATEKEIVSMLGERHSYLSTEIQIKKSLQEMLYAYGLVRVKASKINKAKYNIEDDALSYQSYMICRDIN